MLRRSFLVAAAVMAAPAWAQSVSPAPSSEAIEPQNELERVFVAAFSDPEVRPVFRSRLLESEVVLSLSSSAPDAGPRLLTLPNGGETGFIYTSIERFGSVMGPAAPRRVLSGRAALELLRGKHVALNWRLAPMLTLEPEDVAQYLAQD